MVDELELLRELDGPPSDPSEQSVRRARTLLLEQIDQSMSIGKRDAPIVKRERRRSKMWWPRSPRARWTMRVGVVASVVVVALVGLPALTGGDDSDRIGVVERAYAAVSASTGVLHYVVAIWDAPSGTYNYEEHWADLEDTRNHRVVQTVGGTVFAQRVTDASDYLVVPDDQVRTGEDGRGRVTLPALGKIVRRGGALDASSDPNALGLEPTEGYRELLRTGRLRFAGETVVDGIPAFKLVGTVAEPNGFATVTYLVGQSNYFPIRHTVRREIDVPAAEGGTKRVTLLDESIYLEYEILPVGREAVEGLLAREDQPTAYRPSKRLAPPAGARDAENG